MKLFYRIFFVFISFQFFFVLSSQESKPIWLESSVRNMQYAQEEYFTGFSMVSMQVGETQDKAIERAKENALSDLSDGILVTIKSENTLHEKSVSGNKIEEEIAIQFTSLVQTSSQAEVVGSKFNIYVDKNEKMAYAMAYVSRNDLKMYYQNQISLHLTKVEGTLQTVTTMAKNGYKRRACEECLSAAEHFAAIAYAQNLLTAIDIHVKESEMQQSRSEALRSQVIQVITDLENSIYLYLEITETENESLPAHIADFLPGLLLEQGCGCNVTEMLEEADYIIQINAGVEEYQESINDFVFCYMSATVMLKNRHTQKTFYPKIPQGKGGWSQNNKVKATKIAVENISNIIAEQIIPLIKN